MKGTLNTRKRVITFKCKTCDTELQCPFHEAGTPQQCAFCNEKFVVPCADEVRAFVEAERQQAEQRRQQEMAEERAGRQRRAADEKLRAAERQKRAEAAAALAGKDANWADRFLTFAFSLGKYISVIVVAICFLIIIYFGVLLLAVTEKQVTQPPQKVEVPTVTDYQREVAAAQRSNPPESSSAASPQSAASDSFEERLKRLCYANSINTNVVSEIVRDYRFWLYLGPSEREMFVSGLEKLAADLKAANGRLTVQAMGWYVSEFKGRWEALKEDRERAEREAEMARMEAISRRSYLMAMLGGAIGTLLMFLFLPLAIQIERNTRTLHLLEG